MLEMTQGLWGGFATALTPLYLYYALLGAVLGTITGVLPGLGPLGAMAILLSFTLSMDATGAMILFAGIYYGAMYGGSTTSILLNIPGEAASVVTCIDGYKMAQKGRARGRPDRRRRRVIHRRNYQHLRAHGRRPFSLRHRPPLRTGGIFRHRGLRAGSLGAPERGIAPAVFHHDPRGHGVGDSRGGLPDRNGTVYLWKRGIGTGDRLFAGGDGDLRHCRGSDHGGGKGVAADRPEGQNEGICFPPRRNGSGRSRRCFGDPS